MKKERAYFDYAATTPVDPKVVKAMEPYFTSKFGNPSSLHNFGQEALVGVDEAREITAKFLNCSVTEVVFTSGATEADNIAVRGVVLASKLEKPHVITSSIEHPAVLEVVKALVKEGRVEADFVTVGRDGIVDIEEVKKLVKDNTILISIMYVNNEVGTIQPIREIGKFLEKLNKERKNRIYFHTDAVQAANYLKCEANYLHVDLISLSGHKIYGPKGIGVLYVRSGTKINSIKQGGHQESGLRPGTVNAALIVGFGKALELLNSERDVQVVGRLRDELADRIVDEIPEAQVNGSEQNRIPNSLNVSFKGIEGESAMLMLDMDGIGISTGSACASGSLEPSHVLMAMGYEHLEAHSSLRMTLGRKTTQKDIDQLMTSLLKVINRLREMSPEWKK